MSILDTIREQYGSSNKTRRRISDYILSNTAQCCFHSLREFSEAVGSTEATVINYCRGLGLASYIELKKELQAHVISSQSPSDRTKIAVSVSSSIDSLYNMILKSEREALRDTFEHTGPNEAVGFVSYMLNAQHIFIAAHKASRIPAEYMVQRMLALGVDIVELDIMDQQQVLCRLSAYRPEDCLLIAITMPPYGKSTIAVSQFCQTLGINVISITDNANSPVARSSKQTLVCHTEFMGLTNSCTSMMALINLIYMLYSYQNGRDDPAGQARLMELTRQFEKFYRE